MKLGELAGVRLKLLYWFLGVQARLRPVVASSITSQSIERRKANKAPGWTTYPLPSDVAMSYQTISARSGSLRVKHYHPEHLDPTRARVLFLHGGGWICGGVDTLDHLCANLSRAARCRVVSVDYRLAPETPFPGGLEDCYDALQWVAVDPSMGPPTGVAVVGESAGANLAAALCILAARRGGPAIRHQTLIYPCVDATLASPSMADGLPGFRREHIAQLVELYRGGASLTDPLLSPLYAESHSALPPALIITADLDPARDDGALYARRLTEAGVPVRYLNYRGMPHGFFFMPRICRSAAEGLTEISAAIASLSDPPSHSASAECN